MVKVSFTPNLVNLQPMSDLREYRFHVEYIVNINKLVKI